MDAGDWWGLSRGAVLAPPDVQPDSRAVTRRVRDRRLLDIHTQAQHGADAAAVHPVARRIGPEFMVLEGQREARLRHLDATELDPSGRLSLARGLPAVAGGRRSAAGARVEHVPDERLPGPWVHPLDRDAEAAAPPRERAPRTGRRQRPDHRL